MVSQIKALCAENGTNLFRLEKDLGLANGTIKRWDANTPSADRLAMVASYFGVTMEYLLTGKKEEPAENDGLAPNWGSRRSSARRSAAGPTTK